MRSIRVAVVALAFALPAGAAGQSEAVTPARDALSAPVATFPAESPPASYSLVKEKSRVVVRGLPWASGTATVRAGGDAIFAQAIQELAAEILPTTSTYAIEVKVEEQGSKGESQLLAKKRAAAIASALAGERVPQARLRSAGGGADKDPRVVIAETPSR